MFISVKINLQVDEKGKQKAKKAVIAAIIALAAIAGIIFGYRSYQKQQEEKAKQQYKADLESATITMLSGASEAETAGGLIHDVWYDTIYENKRDSTKKYTMSSTYKFNSDFNTSLRVGEEIARKQLGEGEALIKKEFASNEHYYLTAQKAGISTIESLVRQFNPDETDLKVDVEYY